MSTKISITELRLSFIWRETFSGLIPPEEPLGFLSDPLKYGQEYARMKEGKSAWPWPWSILSAEHFWEFYLENAALASVSGEKAWRALVPLYQPSLAKFSALPESLDRISCEGFYYPHSLAVLLTVVLKGRFTFNQLVERALQARADRYEVTFPNQKAAALSLKEVTGRALDAMRAAARGARARALSPLADPMTIATAIDGRVPGTPKNIPPNGSVHRALEALCRWDPLWRNNKLHPLDDETCFKFKDRDYSRPDHLLYGIDRGRAVWFPGYFGKKNGRPIRKLGCYYRNLTFASLQTESLLALVQIASGYFDRRDPFPQNLERLVRWAAGALGRLYGGSKETYRSWSLYRQIQDSGLVAKVEQLRDFAGLQPAKLSLIPKD